MKSFKSESLNKFETEHSAGKLNLIINKKSVDKEKNRLIEIEMKANHVLADEIFVYAKFKVESSGHYHISNQLAIKALKETKIEVLQHGICDDNYDNYSKCFNSLLLNTNCEIDYIISSNLSSITYLDENKSYVAWVNFQSSKNTNFQFSQQFSNVKLIKL